MSTSTTPIEHATAAAEVPQAVEPSRPVARPEVLKKRPGSLKLLIFLVVVAGIGGVLYATVGPEKLKEKAGETYSYLKTQVVGPSEPAVKPEQAAVAPKKPWTGVVEVSVTKQETIGFKIAPVLAQTQPIPLEVNGTSDYDLDTLIKVRPRFDKALVQKVFVSAGQSVKKGDPILEIMSADLAAAKNDCRTKYVQWDHDHKLLVAREPLAKEGRITQIVWTDTQNDEKKSRLDYFVARDKLLTYKLSKEEIDKLLAGLGDDKKKALEGDDSNDDITVMTVFSPIDGIVVERTVVPGNFYDQTDTLLTISPMTQIWIWGNVFESDQDKVHIGQNWGIRFQFSDEKFEGKVESISNGVDPDTRTLRIRATIPNTGKNLKARMLVRAILQIPPLPGDTVIPRNALSVSNGSYYAFVQKGESGEDATQFERRKLEIEQENSETAVVKSGLKVGDRVVSNGSLILAQMYEDQATVDTGLPVH